MAALVVFSHGKESGPDGSKIQLLTAIAKARGAIVLSVDYTDLPDADARVERLLALPLPPHAELILVGSSMGAYISCVASIVLQPTGLFLLAPAVGLAGYAEQTPMVNARHVSVVMGWQDEVVPVANVVAFAQRSAATLHLLNADHRLTAVSSALAALFGVFLDDVLPAGERMPSR
jgi:alpha/beta superfamily hydrolase